ncbi:MAG: peptidyl-prolyl cis-trans isomerase [Prevotellaceae bacterium]|jgi:hypothetical protein|nr:peptidyl-prolyl cis-trans isomerase [Prevotellaceae bacterium]
MRNKNFKKNAFYKKTLPFLALGLFASFLFISCKNEHFGKREPIAEAGGNLLYKEDVKDIFFAGMSKEDSTAAIENYVRMWATDILLYEKAQENVKDNEQIAALLENYRRSLLVYEYQLHLVKDRLKNNTVSPEEIKAYYNKNTPLFYSDEILIKGLFLKVPNRAPDMDALRKLLSNSKEKDLDQIESMCIRNAAKFEYFNEKWVPLSEIQRKSPIRIENKENLKQRFFYESQDSLSTYFLYVQEYVPDGEPQPLDYAENRIRGILSEQKKNNFLKQFNNKMYNEAVKSGKVKIYEQN